MMQLFVGTTVEDARMGYRAHSKKSDTSFALSYRFDADSWNDLAVLDALQAQLLFGGNTKIVFDDIWEEVERLSQESQLVRLCDQETAHVYLLDTIDNQKKIQAIFPKAKVHSCVGRVEQNSRTRNFDLAEAVVAKDKKRAWLLYQSILAEGISAEELYGSIMWGLKQAVLVQSASSATEAGVKPFVYSKYKKLTEKQSLIDVRNAVWNLFQKYVGAREGVEELEISTERYILEL